MLAATDRSWVMSDQPPCRSRCVVSWSRARISRCTVTSSEVVGSSAIKQVRLQDHRHGDHHALPLPAGELVRILMCCAAPASRNADAVAAVARRVLPGIPALCGPRRGWSSLRRPARPMVLSGWRWASGSWKMMLILRPLIAWRARLRHGFSRSLPLIEHLAAGDLGRRAVEQVHDRRRGDALAGAAFAQDRPAISPRSMWKAHVVQDFDRRFLGEEGDA